MREQDAELARRSPLLAGLSEAQFARVTRGAFAQALPRAAEVCHEGDMAEFLHLILSGRVALLGGEAAHETVVEFFDQGDVFVAPAVMLELPYLMSARVVSPARILMLPAAQFRESLRQEPELTYAMAALLARYWRTLVGQIKDLKLNTALQRLAQFLLALAPREPGPATITLPEERRLIAARLGVTPESLSRAFAQLRASGVSSRGRRVTIADPRGLNRILGRS
jgi:CRP/FNR family transcriptional regulator, transcriptional activator FtrB